MGEGTPHDRPRQAHSGLVVPFSFQAYYKRRSLFCAGYTIIDSLILFNGTLYIVTGREGRWPSLDSISAVTPLEEEQYKNDLRFITPEEAVTLIPPLAGR